MHLAVLACQLTIHSHIVQHRDIVVSFDKHYVDDLLVARSD